MPGDVMDRVQAVAQHFAPTSPVDLSGDLFGHHPRLPVVDPREFAEYDAALRTARRDPQRRPR
jgi:hypothetical protein